jgi:uncharacterized protein HemY
MLGHLGRLLMARKKYAEAEEVFREQSALWELLFGKHDRNYKHTLGDLQSALESQGKSTVGSP